MNETRTESDSLTEVEVPVDAYYGAFTARANENFDITDREAHPAFIQAIAQVKKAAAEANYELGHMDEETRDVIQHAAEDVKSGEFDDQFVLDVIQAGAGTPFHMNANEVIANRATEILDGDLGEYRVDPHDDVNMGQSSNNVVPTSVRIATLNLVDQLCDELEQLEDAFSAKGDEFDDVLKVGRTHLQDAVPVTLGQEFDAYAAMVRNGRERLEDSADELHEIGLGGNAIGTGINTDPSFTDLLAENLAAETGYDLRPTDDNIAMTQSMAPFAQISGTLRSLATDLIKIADDLMFLSSGPKAGLAEITLPEVEPGSSIMPGKVNPSIVEAFKMSCIQVIGNDETIATAAQEGDLELNVTTPLIATNLFESLDILHNASQMLHDKCITGIEANREQIEELFNGSTATATALSPYIGYDKTAQVVQQALNSVKTIREIVIENDLMDEQDVDKVLHAENLTQPNGVNEDLVEKYRDEHASE